MWGRESIRLAEAVGHPYSVGSAYLELGKLYLARGAFDEAVPLLEYALDLSRTRDIPIYLRWTASALASCYGLVGRAGDACALLDEMPKERFGLGPKRSVDSPTVLAFGSACLCVDRPDDAAWFAQRALEISREFGQRGPEAGGLRLVGDILMSRDSPNFEGAEDSYRRALELAEELGLRPLVALCHIGLAKVFRRLGQGEQAQHRFAIAAGMLREMGMRFWLEKAEAELGEPRSSNA